MTSTVTEAPERRHTRAPDRLTDLMLAISAVFGVWGVALVVLTALAIMQPQFFYSDQKAAIKAAASTVVAVLAILQSVTMATAMGQLPKGFLGLRRPMRVHRWSGRVAIVLAALVAFFCMTDLGAPLSPTRAVVHAVFGSTAFAALGVKFWLIRFRPAVAYDLAPWLGRYVAVAFVIVWITSGLAYYTGNL